MTRTERTLTPAELHQALDAECKLAEMDLYEDLALLHDDEPCPILRRWYAERYRKLIGVLPQRRLELQHALERVREDGTPPVREIIDALQPPTA